MNRHGGSTSFQRPDTCIDTGTDPADLFQLRLEGSVHCRFLLLRLYAVCAPMQIKNPGRASHRTRQEIGMLANCRFLSFRDTS